jgi:hypothetical protein
VAAHLEAAMAHTLFPHLSQERFDAARAFLNQHGRPLDVALLNERMQEGSKEAVLAALAPFQNPDGGFGHGLEPDIQSPASSALATSIGLRILRGAGARSDHPMVAATIAWLDATLDYDRGVWPIIGPDVDLAPHAPWWAWSEDLAASWNGFRFNPTADILLSLYAYLAVVPEALFDAVEAGLRRTLAETELIEGAYDLKCALRLAEKVGPIVDIAGPLRLLVRRSLAAHDPNDEHFSVFDVASDGLGEFADVILDRLEPAFGALVDAQAEDGGWTPFWDWSFVDAAAWEKARRDWRSTLTREAVETLLRWERVEWA